MNAPKPPAGSSSSKQAESPTKTTVRRIKDIHAWFEPSDDLKKSVRSFSLGTLTDVTFDPKAKVMEDVFCGSDRVSEATATGILKIWCEGEKLPRMPEGVTRTCYISYDIRRKVFHDKADPSVVINKADIVILKANGQSIAGWL